MNLKVGDLAPNFTLPKDGGGVVSLSEYRGKKVILYFYPKDRGLGCTLEACGFRDSQAKFDEKGVAIIGVSRDSVVSHNNFKEKHNLQFTLASDEKEEISDTYGVLIRKPLLGLRAFGVSRSTFLIDEEGVIANVWRDVIYVFHVKELLKAIG